MKKGINTSTKRRKRIPFDEEENDEEEDDYENDCDSEDDEFNSDNLDFLDEEKELPLKAKKKKKGNPDDLDFLDVEKLLSSKVKNKKKGDSDDDEFYPDDQDFLDEEEELPSVKGKNKKKGNMDDDEFYPDDQDLHVYQPTEEELRDYLDPYENVICTECHEGGDDALMLLCDLCDSPAHRYCVGLGREVPEGNWYCEGCKPSAREFTSSHVQDHTPFQRPNNSALNEPYTFENMAEIDLNITIPETWTGFLVSPRQLPSGGGGLQQAPPPVSGVGTTLSGRRRVRRLQYYQSNNRLSHMGMRVDPTTQSPFLEMGMQQI